MLAVARAEHAPPAEGTIASDPLVRELEHLQLQIKQKGIPVSLDEAIAKGVAGNPRLAQAFDQIQAQEWALIAAKRQWFPTLELNNGSPFVGMTWETYVQDHYAPSSLPNTSAQKSQQLQVTPGVTLAWTFLDPSRQPTIDAQAASLQQQKYLFAVSARSLVLDLQQAYFAIQSSQQLIDSFQQIYAINRRQLQILEARQQIGMVTILDVEQTRSQLFLQLSELIQYIRSYIDQSAQLAELMALPADALALPSEPAAPQGGWDQSLEVTLAHALQQREEILADLAAAESAQWRGIAALRAYLPVFQLVGTGSLVGTNGFANVPVDADSGQAYGSSRDWTAAAGLGFSWPIFDGGIHAANAQTSFAQQRGYLASKAMSELQVMREVRSSFGQMQTALVAIESARRAYASAQVAQEAARARFAVGVGDITSVVQTISQLSTAAQQVSTAILSYNNAVVELYRYSATWSQGVEGEVDQRIKSMRQLQRP